MERTLYMELYYFRNEMPNYNFNIVENINPVLRPISEFQKSRSVDIIGRKCVLCFQ